MLKFLHFALIDYEATHDGFPSSIESGLDQGLLESFPKDRIKYFQGAMNEGRLEYSLGEDGGFKIRMTTCRGRELTVDGVP